MPARIWTPFPCVTHYESGAHRHRWERLRENMENSQETAIMQRSVMDQLERALRHLLDAQ